MAGKTQMMLIDLLVLSIAIRSQYVMETSLRLIGAVYVQSVNVVSSLANS